MTTSTVETTWAGLATPLHATVPHGDGTAAYKDNAYVAFWDQSQDAFGSVHLSTSPNAEGRRARISISIGGIWTEIVEDLEPASFTSASIDFDLPTGRIRVDHPDLQLDLSADRRLALADYSAGEVIPPMNGAPVEHWQGHIELTGPVTLKGHQIELNATGIRDRTWGYRDESVNIAEYFWFFAAFEDFSITAMRFLSADVPDRIDGFVMRAEGTQAVTALNVVRNAAGLAAEIIATLDDGSELRMRSQGRRGGFWLPMGWERHAPAMSAYDEFVPLTLPHGSSGFGVAQHGNVRQLF